MTMTDYNDFLDGACGTAAHVARYLQLSPITVRRKAKEGQLPVVRLGKRVRFRRADIDALLAERTVRTVRPVVAPLGRAAHRNKTLMEALRGA